MFTANDHRSSGTQPILRVRVWYALLLCIITIFLVRLFYLQIIRYDFYKNSALSDQLKQYQIPASRGRILAFSGGNSSQTVPIVLNQKLYLVYGDPLFIKDAAKVSAAVAKITGGDSRVYEKSLKNKDSRYAILAKKVSEDQKTQIAKLKLPGIGIQQQEYRVYPQGAMAAQLLGFVNDAGAGSYGIEQALDSSLKGRAGELKAITDVHGVPLAASSDNTLKPAVPGKDIMLTINLPMQKRLEQILAEGVVKSRGESGSAMDPGVAQPVLSSL